ncbi:MAG: hypothetical protein H6618_00680 [Deltaproteobacteria bacterium]|nr:hypothetical protein [Deltaproteobacteria bacterium]
MKDRIRLISYALCVLSFASGILYAASDNSYEKYGDVSNVSPEDVLSGEFENMFFKGKPYDLNYLEEEYQALRIRFHPDKLNQNFPAELDKIQHAYDVFCSVHGCSSFASIPFNLIKREYNKHKEIIQLRAESIHPDHVIKIIFKIEGYSSKIPYDVMKSIPFDFYFFSGKSYVKRYGLPALGKEMVLYLHDIHSIDEFLSAIGSGFLFCAEAGYPRKGTNFGFTLPDEILEQTKNSCLDRGKIPKVINLSMKGEESSFSCIFSEN